MQSFQTEYEFTLPLGYVDQNGELHKDGVMRLATAADEILTLKDHRVQSNPNYQSIIVLSRVVSKLGNLDLVNTQIIEGLYSADFTYLQELYNKINLQGGDAHEHGPLSGNNLNAVDTVAASPGEH